MNSAARLQIVRLFAAFPAALAVVSCAKVQTESKVDVKPIEVKPIHITVDVNVRVDHELDNFFSFENDPSTTKPARPPATSTQPTTAPTTTTQQTGA